MPRSLVILSAALVLPCVAAILWMLTPESGPGPEAAVPREAAAAGEAASAEVNSGAAGGTVTPRIPLLPRIVRPAANDLPEPETTPRPLASEVRISPRFTPATQSVPGLAGVSPEPGTRLRVLPVQPPAPALSASQDAPQGSSQQQRQGSEAPVVLQVDRSLHDPAAWVVPEKPLSSPQQAVLDRIADEFAASVAGAAKAPDSSTGAVDATWRDARTRANQEYKKFFGSEAANRAGINAGRAALAR